jgi:4a-hydroxytetrahydrobiopterin dehydratase
MPRPLLSDTEIADGLSGTAWEREGEEIATEVKLADFREAMAFVNLVAAEAERLNHHPDITIRWNRVGLRVSTHDSGGLTALDLELARAVDTHRPGG